MSDTPSELVLPVDRGRAFMRGVWRLAVMLIVAAPAFIMTVNINWSLLRLSDPASFFGLGALWLTLAIISLSLLVSAIRWILLSLWWKPTEIRIGATQMIWSLGPFGERTFERRRLQTSVFPEIEPELLERVPTDALTISILDRNTGEDVGRKLEMFVRLDPRMLLRAVGHAETQPDPGSG